MADDAMEKIVSLCKRRGFIYPGSEIYGGLSGTWDYGPFGVELKNNVKQLWWKMFVQDRDDMVGVDAAILMNPRAWEASGHVAGFSDPLVECKKCKKRVRVDQVVDELEYKAVGNKLRSLTNDQIAQDLTIGEIYKEFTKLDRTERHLDILNEYDRYTGGLARIFLNEHIKCPNCGTEKSWDSPRQFNMMFKTQIGAMEDATSVSYLRPETAGGIFVNFKNVVDSVHPKLPFGIAQIGKAFRNEIAPRDFVFRSREFEQMEIEYFVRPTEWEAGFEEWRKNVHAFNAAVGINADAVYELEVADGDRAHYSKRTIDFEFDFPFGRKELYGLAYRTDFDLTAHAKASGQNLAIVDKDGEPAVVPHVIEPSFGVDRTILAILTSAYTEDTLGSSSAEATKDKGETRTYLKFAPAVAPIKAAVFPLLKNKPELVAKAREVYLMLKRQIPQIMWDDNGNIGKRYRRQDEIGTPYCITIDFDTLGEKPEHADTVTVRDRDTGAQQRVAISDLTNYLKWD